MKYLLSMFMFMKYLLSMFYVPAGIQGKKTNHGARRTTIQHLRKHHVPAERIMKLTGQNNLKSIMAYDSPDEEEQMEISNVVSKLHGCVHSSTVAAPPASTVTTAVTPGTTPHFFVATGGLSHKSPCAVDASTAQPVPSTSSASLQDTVMPEPQPAIASLPCDLLDEDLDRILSQMPIPQSDVAPSFAVRMPAGMFSGATFNGPVHFHF